ncbi:MAG: cold shock domain-containing protein [Bdellovibrionales bacterium]|nr:cold shock domain-containing protein [Bdellovibrionales bacterium]
MRTGRIKWYNAFQSHGYIVLLDGTEVYFHSSSVSHSGLIDHLNPGADVSFDLIETRGGQEAHNVELIGW